MLAKKTKNENYRQISVKYNDTAKEQKHIVS